MALEAVPIAEISEAQLRALVEDEVPEGRGIDYKLTLPGTSVEDKKEFLADVSSFANAGGGDIVFGLAESGGMPTGVPGLSDDLDEAMLRLESSIRDGIAPRIQGVVSRPINLGGGTKALVLRVPRSLSRPHVVVYKNHWKFHGRSSNGKHQMDVDEVRSAFVGSEAVAERVRAFRLERLGLPRSGDTPVLLPDGPRAVLHVLPLSAFDSPAPSALDLEAGGQNALHALRGPGSGGTPRYNFDGLICEGRGEDGVEAYAQLFRAGGVEGVTVYPFAEESGRHVIAVDILERDMISALRNYLDLQRQLGAGPPTLVMLSLLGVRGYEIPNGSRRRHPPVDRDDLLVPETIIREDDLAADQLRADQVLQPAFNAVWNACGYPSSPNYRQDGRWAGGQ